MKWKKLNRFSGLTRQIGLVFIFYFSVFSFSYAQGELPIITVRFENSMYDANTKMFCADVEFQSSTANLRLFGMNVRFFYEKDVMDFNHFTDFLLGYGAVNPNPAFKNIMAQGSGSLFGFKNNAVYINGAVQLTNPNAEPVFLFPDNWTRIFSVCFSVSDSKSAHVPEFKPQIVWDLDQNPLKGGFMPGSEGVVITVLKGDSSINSLPAREKAIHLNWKAG